MLKIKAFTTILSTCQISVNRDFKLFYIPHEELSIDESLVGTLCHFSITQYLSDKKHHRWNIKF
ncbi:piggyBac transposable element-derived protein 4-like [Vespula maculifrons]|uniref:PiggyBac transposable element-derived protein 4-like n=1 Tax=Vespula maculifrons TaxID=7453 RepID=A0ABD2AGU8_VESMC